MDGNWEDTQTTLDLVRDAADWPVSRAFLHPVKYAGVSGMARPDYGIDFDEAELPLLRDRSESTYKVYKNPDQDAVARLQQDMQKLGTLAALNWAELENKYPGRRLY